MKLVALLLFFVLHSAASLYSQEYNEIIYHKVFINQLPLGTPKSIVIKKLGKPVKISKHESMTYYWFDYQYKQSAIQIDTEGDLNGFDIVDSSFVLTCNSINIKIGDSASVLKKAFPKSYKHYRTTKDNYLRVQFKDADAYILFSIKNNRITGFHTWEEDS